MAGLYSFSACWLLVIAAALQLQCAAYPRASSADPTRVDVSRNGLLILRVVSNRSSTPILAASGALMVSRAGTAQSLLLSGYRLLSRSSRHSGTALFYGFLEAGRYSLERLEFAGGSAPLRSGDLEFEVQPDRVTDLGHLVLNFTQISAFVPLLGEFQAGRVPGGDARRSLAALPEALASRFSPETFLKDTAARSPGIAPAAARYAQITARPDLLGGEQAVFGRALGHLFIFKPSENRLLETALGELGTVQTAALDQDGSILVGLDEGRIVRGAPPSWEAIAGPRPGATIRLLRRTPQGRYIALIENRTACIVLVADAVSGPWEELRSFATGEDEDPRDIPITDDDACISVALAGNDFLLTSRDAGFLRGETRLHHLDTATLQWTDRPLAGAPGIVPPTIQVFDGRAVLFSVLGKSIHVSRDLGGSWLEREQPKAIRAATFAGNDTLYLAFQDLPFFSLELGTGFSLWKSDDGGVSLQRVGPLPDFTRELHALPLRDHLLATDLIGQTFLSKDDGKSWERQGSSAASER